MNRIKWIDLTRVIAILTVIFCHCLDNIYHIMDPHNVYSLSITSKIFVFTGYSIGRIGVPLFLLITGYLLLDRTYDSAKTKRFWSRNCKQLIICTISWCIIYELFLIFFMKNDFKLISVIADILLLRPIEISHFWYMPMIIGMYILIPFVANSLKEFDKDIIIKPILFYLIICSIIPFLLVILKTFGIKGLSAQISIGFSGGIYGIYLITGYLIKKGLLNKIKSHILILAIVFCIIITVAFQIFEFNHKYTYILWYDIPFIFVISTCLFELISRIKNIPSYNLINFLSKFSFAVFLIHMIFRNILSDIFIKINIPAHFKVFLLWIILILISYTVSYLIYKIPKFGKYILYIRD